MPAAGLRIAVLLCGVLVRPAAGCTCPSSHPTCYSNGYCYDGDMDEPNYGCGSWASWDDCSANSPPPPPPPPPPTLCSSYSSCGTCVGQDEPGVGWGVNECDFCRSGGYCSHTLGFSLCSDAVYGPSGSCTACDAGEYWTGSRCSSCAPGRYSTGGEVTSCRECAAGQYADGTGETSCTNCHAGQFATNSASARCFDCNEGKYQDFSGATSCKDCPSGRSSSAGSDESSDCVAGACSIYSGASNCAQCVAHTSEVAFELENAWEALGNMAADLGFDAGQSDCDVCRTTGVCGPLQAGCDDEVPHGTSCATVSLESITPARMA
jgi:hypothetical protein